MKAAYIFILMLFCLSLPALATTSGFPILDKYIFNDTFMRANSDSVGNGWTESEPSSSRVSILNNQVREYSDSAVNAKLIHSLKSAKQIRFSINKTSTTAYGSLNIKNGGSTPVLIEFYSGSWIIYHGSSSDTIGTFAINTEFIINVNISLSNKYYVKIWNNTPTQNIVVAQEFENTGGGSFTSWDSVEIWSALNAGSNYIGWLAAFNSSAPPASDKAPYYDTVSDNSTSLTPNATDTIGLSIHLLDDINISHLFTSWNMTGTWVNFSALPIGLNDTTAMIDQPILYLNNQTIGYRFMFNDSINQWNYTGIYTFIAKNISVNIPPDFYPHITLITPLNWSSLIMGVDTIYMKANCSDDHNVSEMQANITYGADTIFGISTTSSFIDQDKFIVNNLTQDLYSMQLSCTDDAGQTSYEYDILAIYNYLFIDIITPYMQQHYYVPDMLTQADINMTWTVNQFSYCCDAVNDVWVGCDYVPADVETYNQYLLTEGTYNITRACTIPDSYATAQEYRIVQVEIPNIPYCINLSISDPYFKENVTVTANITTSELAWVEFIWNDTVIYNMSVTGDSILRQDSIKNKIAINDSINYGYNFSDSAGLEGSCIGSTESRGRPSETAPLLNFGVCPSTQQELIFIIFISVCAILLILAGFFGAYTLGIFGGLLFLLLCFSIIPCNSLIGIILFCVSLLIMIGFVLRMAHQ